MWFVRDDNETPPPSYGVPSQAGFGSAVFEDQLKPDKDLEFLARQYYQHFVGELWEKYGEAAWMSTWKLVYARSPGLQPNIVAELKAIADPQAIQFMPFLLLTDTDDRSKAQQALEAVFNHPQITDLRVYAIGDDAAMPGLLVAGNRSTGETTILVSLLD
ncbi:MAG: hypothetical protein KME02_03245 [Aphanothece saxicola GSE-SYN-MK-01-06B]|jgi:hypothetical protein|nr:hypothetical protein [Aphanothece saxicola GSE-SYN-MK-01-06B]